MAKQKKQIKENMNEELLKKLLITQLVIARVPQKEIGKIVGISVGSVNAIAKYVKLPKENE
jgi:hypothetical protein